MGLLRSLAKQSIQRLPGRKSAPRDIHKMTRLDLQRKALNGHLKISFQVAEQDRIGLGFMLNRDGFVELGAGG